MLFFGDTREIATLFDIEPTRPNLRRIDRAIQIVDTDGIEYLRYNGYQHEYEVRPQGGNPKMHGTDRKYIVRTSGSNFPTCDCPDWRKPNGKPLPPEIPNLHRCKHGIAVLLYRRFCAEK